MAQGLRAHMDLAEDLAQQPRQMAHNRMECQIQCDPPSLLVSESICFHIPVILAPPHIYILVLDNKNKYKDPQLSKSYLHYISCFRLLGNSKASHISQTVTGNEQCLEES